mgnify:CR=1 FL=1
MKNSKTLVFNRVLLFLGVLTLPSCMKLIDKAATKVDRVDLTVDIDGKKTEFTSGGFTYMPAVNNKRELMIPFVKGASLLTVDGIEITIPNFIETKTVYNAQKGEVVVTYKANQEVYEDQSPLWVSKEGTLEITRFNGERVEGKLNVILKTSSSSKTKEFKNGVFKSEKLL